MTQLVAQHVLPVANPNAPFNTAAGQFGALARSEIAKRAKVVKDNGAAASP